MTPPQIKERLESIGYNENTRVLLGIRHKTCNVSLCCLAGELDLSKIKYFTWPPKLSADQFERPLLQAFSKPS
jgi:hypothetical protein